MTRREAHARVSEPQRPVGDCGCARRAPGDRGGGRGRGRRRLVAGTPRHAARAREGRGKEGGRTDARARGAAFRDERRAPASRAASCLGRAIELHLSHAMECKRRSLNVLYALYCTVLHCTVHCTVLYTALHCTTVLYCTIVMKWKGMEWATLELRPSASGVVVACGDGCHLCNLRRVVQDRSRFVGCSLFRGRDPQGGGRVRVPRAIPTPRAPSRRGM